MSGARQIIEIMEEYGLRITEQRKTLAVIFEGSKQPLSPKDVYERMNILYKGLSLDTVYRNIRTLIDISAIEPIGYPDGVRYQAISMYDHHHHHLICLDCEQTFPLNICPIELGMGIPEHFKIIRHTFEVQGYCGSCLAENSE